MMGFGRNRPHTLYGWQLSYFTGKVRCYLLHKGVDFVEKPCSAWDLMGPLRWHTGAAVMPVVRTPEGVWLQDSSTIIDHFERTRPEPSVLPRDPVLRVLAHVLEAWCDEWWIPMAMHSRWSHAENYALFEREAGAHLLPRAPRALQRRAAALVADKLRAMTPGVGIRPGQTAWIDGWSVAMLDHLDAHLAHQPYLLGGGPTLADFALAGPMIGHLSRDPWPAREWVEPRPHLANWIERMRTARHPDAAEGADSAARGLTLAPTLQPVLAAIADEFLPMLQGVAGQVRERTTSGQTPAGQTLPRALGDVTVQGRHGTFSRRALPYTLWMAQRVRDAVDALQPADREQVRRAMDGWGLADWLSLDMPRLERRALRVAVAAGSPP